jgi:PAS domain S-box-containing protein
MESALRQAEAAHEQARAELRESEHRFRQLVEGVPQLLWRATDAGQWTWASLQWTQFTGQAEAASHGRGWLDSVHPDDRRRARRAWRLAEGAQAFDVEYRIRGAGEKRYRWFQARAAPVRDGTGTIVEWLGTATDIDDLKRLREHESVLLAELQHRARNTLAVVRSIARRTAENSDSIDTFQMHFDGRLGAFARAQSLVTHDPDSGIDLETLIAEELFAHHAHEGGQARIAGPPVRLKPKIADIVGLAIHELAVNAVKYGGLSSDLGSVKVTWQVEGPQKRRILALSWTDSAPDRPVAHRRHQGFGSELIERSLVYELDAESSIDFAPDGVHCTIRLPLTGRTA